MRSLNSFAFFVVLYEPDLKFLVRRKLKRLFYSLNLLLMKQEHHLNYDLRSVLPLVLLCSFSNNQRCMLQVVALLY